MDVRVTADMQGTNFFFFYSSLVPVCDGGGVDGDEALFSGTLMENDCRAVAKRMDVKLA